jgi:hypothetical protein
MERRDQVPISGRFIFLAFAWGGGGGCEAKHKKPQPELPVSSPRFEPWTSQMQRRRSFHVLSAKLLIVF